MSVGPPARQRPTGRRGLGRDGTTSAAVVVAVLAVLVPSWLAMHPKRQPHGVLALHATPTRVVPRNEVPAVEPVRLADLTPDQARDYNAAVPFSTAPIPAARPFRFVGGGDDLARARDCLAAGELYEAGDDTTGERAVAQVVLNRLRHPAFPKTICGVVFQGSERSTGCQFTFSCDGALDRWHPSETAWQRARDVADAALGGKVFHQVGYATHYHTDWVVPYWQASLDKVARVATHLFFRWSGWWGTPPAFRFNPRGVEPVVPALAALSEAHRPATLAPTLATAALPTNAAQLGDVAGPDAAGPVFMIALPKAATPDQYPLIAAAACIGHPYCKYLGWADRTQVPAAVPTGDQSPTGLAFSYLRDPKIDYDKALWNCRLTPRSDRAQCMRGTMAPAASRSLAPSDVLSGVRRRSAAPIPAPTTTASPTSVS